MLTKEQIKKILTRKEEHDPFKAAMEKSMKPFIIIDPEQKAVELLEAITGIKDTTESQEKKKDELRKEYKGFESKLHKYWNDFVGKHPVLGAVTVISDKRRTWLKNRFMKKHFRENVFKAIDEITNSRFLLGDNKRKWKVSFDFIIKNNNNYLKILEHVYGGSNEKTGIDKWIDE